MSEYYDHYHRWEPLAEFHFDLNSDDEEYDDENYLYCLCSRAYIRDGVKTYYGDKEEGSESDVEVMRDSQSQEDQSHVHFSLDTSYKVKCEKDEGASCYCSASHTDNCCSTDEHDAAQTHGTSHALQPSDSGADLTYHDCHSDYTNHEKLERMDQDFPIQESDENYLSENTWDKFWAINGERLIWASWIKKYSDYINPAYLDDNNELKVVDDSSMPKQRSVDQIYRESDMKNDHDEMRERKFSYDSKVNPYKKGQHQNQTEKLDRTENKDESWHPVSRRRSCSEHERIVSPRTFAGTDSMTNVTKITLSSYDVTSSHVTSESSTDDYSVSSTTSDDQSNDQTRIANVENGDPNSVDEMDMEQYWQFLWKKHFGDQYALHCANYIASQNAQSNDVPTINVESIEDNLNKIDDQKLHDKSEERILDIECENSEGHSQELPTVIEVQTQVEEMKLEEPPKTRKRGKKKSNKYLGSVGLLLQNLLKGEIQNTDNSQDVEVTEAGDENNEKKDKEPVTDSTAEGSVTNLQQSASNTNFTSYSYDDGDEDPPEETPVSLKRSHEIDDEEPASEKIKATFEIMGFSIKDNEIPKGQMVFRKRLTRLRPPRYKRFGAPRKTYFDDDGKPMQLDEGKDSQDEREMQTDEECFECPDFKSEAVRLLESLVQNNEPDKKTKSIENKDENENKDGVDNSQENMTVDVNRESETGKLEEMSKESSTKEIKDPPKIYDMSVDNSSIESQDSKPEDSAVNISKDKVSNKTGDIINNTNIEIKDTSKDEMQDSSKEQKQQSKTEIVAKEDVTDIVNFKTPETVKISEEPSVSKAYDVQNRVESANDDDRALEASAVPLPDDLDQSSDNVENDEKGALEFTVTQNVESTKRRRRQKRYAKLDEEELSNVPEELRDDPKMMKYWKKRHSLFHRFDEGIRLDRESWFSVTPENVARHIARKYTYDTVLDAFCGAGGNTIQFAFTSKKVIAVDIDPAKIAMAQHNAAVYGVADRIHFIVGDFFQLAPALEADMVFLSPPWGGPTYSNNAQYDIETMLEPKPASELMAVARNISSNISLYLPRNTRPDQILSLAKEVGGSVEVEQSYLDKRFVAITAYFY